MASDSAPLSPRAVRRAFSLDLSNLSSLPDLSTIEAPPAPLARPPREPRIDPPLPPAAAPVRRGRGRPRKGGSPDHEAAPASAPDPLTIKIDTSSPRPNSVSPEEREQARTILDEIGRRFAENRKKGKSNAYEIYQHDLAENSHYLVMGGLMNLKEISELLMKIEEFRKTTTEHGKTPATLLGEWLRGESIPTE